MILIKVRNVWKTALTVAIGKQGAFKSIAPHSFGGIPVAAIRAIGPDSIGPLRRTEAVLLESAHSERIKNALPAAALDDLGPYEIGADETVVPDRPSAVEVSDLGTFFAQDLASHRGRFIGLPPGGPKGWLAAPKALVTCRLSRLS